MTNVIRFAAEGRFIDAGNKERFLAHARERIGDRRWAVIDISGLEFIDSSGMGALLSLSRELEGRGGALALAGPTGAVKAAFDIVYFRFKMRIFPDVPSAMRDLAERSGEP